MHRVGIDIGSTRTKYAVMNDSEQLVYIASEMTPVRQRTFFEQKSEEFKKRFRDSRIISCGYGKGNIVAVYNINELTALARGTYHITHEDGMVLDIGGQDTKYIFQEEGVIKEFFVNEKCAAGSGIFLLNTLNLLGLRFEQLDLREVETPKRLLSSVCAVFAQSEIVVLLAENYPEKDIIEAVICQILSQASGIIDKLGGEKIFLTGGLSQIPGIATYAAKIFKRSVVIPPYSVYLSAIGCCLSGGSSDKPVPDGRL